MSDAGLPSNFPHSIVVMGVEGSGKTTVGRALAQSVDFDFLDADWLHSPANRAKMAAGHSLDDADRVPWLHSVGQRIGELERTQPGVVTACSALKVSYRDVLRGYDAATYFVFLDGPEDVIVARVASRHHEFMPATLLASQFATLEPLTASELGVRVDVTLTPEEIVRDVVRTIEQSC
jgi:gluconokinase